VHCSVLTRAHFTQQLHVTQQLAASPSCASTPTRTVCSKPAPAQHRLRPTHACAQTSMIVGFLLHLTLWSVLTTANILSALVSAVSPAVYVLYNSACTYTRSCWHSCTHMIRAVSADLHYSQAPVCVYIVPVCYRWYVSVQYARTEITTILTVMATL
jgi:hypothetical protein